MQLIPNIGLAKFKLHPTKNAQESPITCVLANNVSVFYTVTPERMAELLEASDKLDEIRDLLDNLHSSGRLIYSDYSQLHDMTQEPTKSNPRKILNLMLQLALLTIQDR